MEEFRHIGKRIPKVDARNKVTGLGEFTDDIMFHNMLHGAVKHSPHAHARIKKIDTSKAKKVPGVAAVISAEDLPDLKFGLTGSYDYVVLARGRALFVGDAVALVAAEDQAAAQEAVDLIKVEYEELPAVFDMEEAWQPDCPVEIHPDFYESRVVMPGGCSLELLKQQGRKNLSGYFRVRTGDVDKAFQQADVVVENRYTTQWMTPTPLEPDCAIAQVDANGEVTVWGSNQCPYMVRTELSDALGLPLSKIRVIVPYVGGGFGNKLELKAEAMATALALFTNGRPVKVRWSREETFNYTSHPSIIYAKDGFKKDGTLVAREFRWLLDTGSYGGWSALKVKNSAFGALGIYKVPNFKLDCYGVFTNKPITVSQRGFGSRQPVWAIENQMDEAARELGIDPVELRLKNVMVDGDVNASGETMESVGAKDCLVKVNEAMQKWPKLRRTSGHIKRGRGIALGTKYSLVPIAAAVIVKVCEDAAIEVRCSAVDMGQGITTVLAQTAAEEFNIPIDRVKVIRVDTAVTPFGFGASSNTQTQIAGHTLRVACDDVKEQIFAKAAPLLEAKPEDLDTADSVVFVKDDPDNAIPIVELYTYMPLSGLFLDEGGEFIGKATVYHTGTVYDTDPMTGHTAKMSNYWGYACLGVEVEVDTDTGQVKVSRMASSLDCGKAIYPPGVEGQIEGGFSMGMGQALFEEMLFDEKGRCLNPNFTDYKLPTSTDHPALNKSESIIVECPHKPERMWGGKGVGEATITPMVAGIGLAVNDAVGVRLKDPPITPERILRALGTLGGKE